MVLTKHEFALFASEVSQIRQAPSNLIIQDELLVHRMRHVVRLGIGDALVLFDDVRNAHCSLLEVSKKSVRLQVHTIAKNQQLAPALHWLLPILEREAFEEALYALAAMGATTITPVITEKSRKKWGTPKDCERARRIMIAAAEQSKHFTLPTFYEIRRLHEVVHENVGQGLFFDVSGEHAFDIMQQVRQKRITSLTCLVGPEGDLTPAEKDLVRGCNFMVCKLTPTVLRASHAVMVGMGIMRSCAGDTV